MDSSTEDEEELVWVGIAQARIHKSVYYPNGGLEGIFLATESSAVNRAISTPDDIIFLVEVEPYINPVCICLTKGNACGGGWCRPDCPVCCPEIDVEVKPVESAEAKAWDEAVRQVAGVDPQAIHNPYRTSS